MSGRLNTGKKMAGEESEEETRWDNVLQVPHLACMLVVSARAVLSTLLPFSFCGPSHVMSC